MSAGEVRRLAYAEFVAGEDGAGDKREYWDGFVLAMSGGSVRHSALSTRVLTELAVRLRGSSCEPYNSDLRVRVGDSSRAERGRSQARARGRAAPSS